MIWKIEEYNLFEKYAKIAYNLYKDKTINIHRKISFWTFDYFIDNIYDEEFEEFVKETDVLYRNQKIIKLLEKIKLC